jgi:hypothetical protein
MFLNQGNASSKHSYDNTIIIVSFSMGLATSILKRRRGLGKVALGKKMTQHR